MEKHTISEQELFENFEKTFASLLVQVKNIHDKISSSKTLAKKNFYKKKLNNLKKVVEQYFNLYLNYKHQQQK